MVFFMDMNGTRQGEVRLPVIRARRSLATPRR
jgi:hypothetical protein